MNKTKQPRHSSSQLEELFHYIHFKDLSVEQLMIWIVIVKYCAWFVVYNICTGKRKTCGFYIQQTWCDCCLPFQNHTAANMHVVFNTCLCTNDLLLYKVKHLPHIAFDFRFIFSHGINVWPRKCDHSRPHNWKCTHVANQVPQIFQISCVDPQVKRTCGQKAGKPTPWIWAVTYEAKRDFNLLMGNALSSSHQIFEVMDFLINKLSKL